MTTNLLDTVPYEVQENIERYFRQHELPVCLRVCRAWRTIFAPILWKHVDVPPGKNECPPPLTEIVRLGSAGWRSLVFHVWYTHYEFTPELLDAICEHAPTLKFLDLGGDTFAHGDSIDRLLCSLPNLKVLSIENHHQARHNGGWLDARAIVETEWVCKNLEVLCCEIRNIPRPDITRDIFGGPANDGIKGETLEESVALQRQIHTKLALFTKLRELTLSSPIDEYECGHHDKERYRQHDCLSMTLESGLDLLKNLKELGLVNLQEMEVYVNGDQEQKWIAEYWPNARIETMEYSDQDRDSDTSSNSGLFSWEAHVTE
ncbi:hypothetical protein BGZ47_000989 [Haplosporangium gracile]|nr:hypothetical protein BGZ47_000989 [Haplosporangium gracile]